MPDSDGGFEAAGGTLRRALLVLGAANTIIVATEFIVIGLLPVLAHDLEVSLAQAGYLVGAFAAAAALLGPPITIAALALPIRGTLTAILLLFAATNGLALLIPDYAVLLAVRIVQGAALPAFISLGSVIILSMARPGEQGRALAQANIGFVLGLIVAMPAGVALSAQGLWAPSFAMLTSLSLGAAILVRTALPITRRNTRSATHQWLLLVDGDFLRHLLLSVAIFSATFCAYVYLSAWLEAEGYGSLSVAILLAYFGLVGLIGNHLAANFADRIPMTATLIALAVVPAAALAAMRAQGLLPLLLLLGLWGAAHTACVALSQVRVTLAGTDRPAFAMALNISSANLGIALGALAGGAIVERWGIGSVGWGAATIGLAAATFAQAVRMPRPGMKPAAMPEPGAAPRYRRSSACE